MLYEENHKDLFTVDESYHLAHCIASDLRMGAGIAVPMQNKFGIRGKIQNSGKEVQHPTCILTDRVFNLITKKRSSGKPTFTALTIALQKMKEIALNEGIEKIAMPKIGCGLDCLSWGEVREKIKELFSDTDIDILVCIR